MLPFLSRPVDGRPGSSGAALRRAGPAGGRHARPGGGGAGGHAAGRPSLPRASFELTVAVDALDLDKQRGTDAGGKPVGGHVRQAAQRRTCRRWPDASTVSTNAGTATGWTMSRSSW